MAKSTYKPNGKFPWARFSLAMSILLSMVGLVVVVIVTGLENLKPEVLIIVTTVFNALAAALGFAVKWFYDNEESGENHNTRSIESVDDESAYNRQYTRRRRVDDE